ncbi:HXXEE domain-containing protein [endosymbiont 'TC1' of Trimyema compressum]
MLQLNKYENGGKTMGIETIIWLFLVAFMIHEFEEIICLTTWTKKSK